MNPQDQQRFNGYILLYQLVMWILVSAVVVVGIDWGLLAWWSAELKTMEPISQTLIYLFIGIIGVLSEWMLARAFKLPPIK